MSIEKDIANKKCALPPPLVGHIEFLYLVSGPSEIKKCKVADQEGSI